MVSGTYDNIVSFGGSRLNRADIVFASGLCVFSFLALLSGEAAQPSKKPHFTDVASRSKIPYKTNNSFLGRKYFIQPMCGGVAAFDFDNDGKLDIFFANGARFPEMKKTDPGKAEPLLKDAQELMSMSGKAAETKAKAKEMLKKL